MDIAQMLLTAESNPATKFTHPLFTSEEAVEFPNTSVVKFEDGFEMNNIYF